MRMKLIFALLSFALASAAAATEIHKCAEFGTGAITYQDAPCPRGTSVGAIERDTRQADPEALRHAEEDRRLLAQILLAKASRPQPPQVVVAPGAMASNDVAYSDAAASDGYYYGPAYGAGTNGRGRDVNKARGNNVLQQSAILDSPAPCNTPFCGSRSSRPAMSISGHRASAGGHGHR
jgi:hypothetical protein